MQKTYRYFQPEYVKEFQCDGQACQAHCCKYWSIEIDRKTYKKYSHIKPKKAANEIVRHIKKNDKADKYFVALDERRRCPMLTQDNWCMIQRKYGEEYLSETCVTYPRRTWGFNEFFERSLTMTCPVAAEKVLLAREPLKFEFVDVPEIIHSNRGRISTPFPQVPVELWRCFPEIQSAAISILQERSLSIDRRLIVLGFFLDRLDEICKNFRAGEIEKMAAIYRSAGFVQEQAPLFAQVVQFDVKEHIRIIFTTFETLYGGDSLFKNEDKKFIDAVVETLQVQVDENDRIAIGVLVKNYSELADFRKDFVERFETVFENFLVNEFFMNTYPWRFRGSIAYNYGVFVTIYKMLELVTMSLANSKSNKDSADAPLDETDLMQAIMTFVNHTDHSRSYINKISEHLSGKEDIVDLMRSLLQG